MKSPIIKNPFLQPAGLKHFWVAPNITHFKKFTVLRFFQVYLKLCVKTLQVVSNWSKFKRPVTFSTNSVSQFCSTRLWFENKLDLYLFCSKTSWICAKWHFNNQSKNYICHISEKWIISYISWLSLAQNKSIFIIITQSHISTPLIYDKFRTSALLAYFFNDII